MSMAIANFPHQGPIENPVLEDYEGEVLLMCASAGVKRAPPRWEAMVRRLSWVPRPVDGG